MQHVTVSIQSQFCFITVDDIRRKGVSATCDAVCKHVHDALARGFMIRITLSLKGELHHGFMSMLGQDLASRFDPFILMQRLRISADSDAKRLVSAAMMRSIAMLFARHVLEGDFTLDLKVLRIDKEHTI